MFEFEQLVDTDKLYEMLEGAETELPRRWELVSAVYFLFNESDEIIYVGQAKNVTNRIGGHKNGQGNSKDFYKELAYCSFIQIESASMRTFIEGAYIQLLQPIYNNEVKGHAVRRTRMLSEEQVIDVKKRLMVGGRSDVVAKSLGLSPSIVGSIRNQMSYTDVIVEGFGEWAKKDSHRNLSARDIFEIYNLRFTKKLTIRDISIQYSKNASAISSIINGWSYPTLFKKWHEEHGKELA